MTRLPASIARSIAACEDRALLIAIEMHKDYSAVRLKIYDVTEVKIEGTVMHRSLILVGVLTITFVVWLVGHSLDVLAMISPFPFLDFLLKTIRNTIFAVVAVTALISPHLGLLLCLGLIVFSFLLFGWALRTAVFGTVFALGLLRVLLFDAQDKPTLGESVPAFSTRVHKVPRRTYGRLHTGQEGTLTFGYRRLLVGPEKKVVVGKSSSFEVGQGIFFPSVIEPIESASKHNVVFRLLPTHRGAEESVRACVELAQVRDIRFTKGIRSFWKFVTEAGESSVNP